MIARAWMTQDIHEKIKEIAIVLPFDILEHALDLIEEMDIDDDEYRSRLINCMWKAIKSNEGFSYHCSNTPNYDIFHEFCIYLDGWLWRLECDEDDKNKDIECCWVNLERINK